MVFKTDRGAKTNIYAIGCVFQLFKVIFVGQTGKAPRKRKSGILGAPKWPNYAGMAPKERKS